MRRREFITLLAGATKRLFLNTYSFRSFERLPLRFGKSASIRSRGARSSHLKISLFADVQKDIWTVPPGASGVCLV
jgi:hypothetical protein